jgi:hypothetical protein
VLPGTAFTRDPNAERMLMERGFRDVDPENLRVAASSTAEILKSQCPSLD